MERTALIEHEYKGEEIIKDSPSIHAYELGWQVLTNGDLLNQAELSGFEILATTDQNLKYQQNLVN